MMSMTEEKLCKKKMFAKKYTWKKEWVRPYESSFGILLNFCKVNALDGAKALRQLGKSAQTTSVCEMLAPQDYIDKMQMFLNMKKKIRDSMLEERLCYCPECRKIGYHSVFHQLFNVRICIFHKVPLEYDGDDDRYGESYRTESIVYDGESGFFSNARNIPHPSLRAEDPAVQNESYYKYLKHDIIEHVILHACYTSSEYVKLQQERVYPLEFLCSNSSYKQISISHYDGSDDELLKLMQSGSHPLQAIYEYEQTDQRTSQVMKSRHIIFNHFVYLHYYYLYCMFKNLLGSEVESYEFRKIDITKEKTLSITDTVKLKLSFIWSVKGSFDWQVPLSFYWVMHPECSDNNNYREVINGVRLEDIYLSFPEVPNPDVNEMLVCIYIIEDLFWLLWEQYKDLARRPQGVSVRDGWKELRVPEYYVCKKDNDSGLYLYRKKHI